MKKLLYSLLFVLGASAAPAQQSLDECLQTIVANNMAYRAQQAGAKAQQVENRLGNTPDNPQIEGGYLWGSPSAIGHRKDFSVSQELAFPTVYHHQRKLADLRDQQAEMSSDQFRLEVMQQAAQLWVELVSLNQRIAIQEERSRQAQALADAYAERLVAGDANRIDRNKAALNQLQAQKTLDALQQERELLQLSLEALNGNQPLPVARTSYEAVVLPPDFERWASQLLAQNPQARWYVLEADAAKRAVKLNQSRSLPSISGGYMMEKTVGEQFQGVTLGLSVPLWENKQAVKAARLRQEAAVLEQQSVQLQLKAELYQRYRAVELASARVDDMRRQLASFRQQDLLDDALEAGQISLIDYLLELQYDYQAVDELYEAEKQLQLAWVSIKVWEM
ncbi:TolC family protein [Mangrovibacterium marinum]|uniref:Outer membrane protein TolC n=1 Tax=Mangrovibacterium marinum TaxID=1639118 RepID=A0A2T5C0Q7_9BACT|nr:TolC family protein [Mangrovibacterium marinum]PTN08195.1 outer membrane protein TolC [Mangrovibacterium marinum]